MLVVYSANGEMYKLRAADAKEKQFWVTQLRACSKYHMETSSKVNDSKFPKPQSHFAPPRNAQSCVSL
uniref:PH domain-containing protein n=1 Tax=Panthera tigris altaica TaxID=74533 RepID=A0A8C9JGT3_PANTA